MFFFFFFDKYKDELKATLQEPGIQYIANSEEFYFQKAKDKFEEYQSFDASNIDIAALIERTKQPPFSFEGVLNSYDRNSDEHKFLLLVGQVISYFDSNAAMKNILNEYEDKRTVALAFVRQNY